MIIIAIIQFKDKARQPEIFMSEDHIKQWFETAKKENDTVPSELIVRDIVYRKMPIDPIHISMTFGRFQQYKLSVN